MSQMKEREGHEVLVPLTGRILIELSWETGLKGLWGKNMASHDRVKNTPQRNGEET